MTFPHLITTILPFDWRTKHLVRLLMLKEENGLGNLVVYSDLWCSMVQVSQRKMGKVKISMEATILAACPVAARVQWMNDLPEFGSAIAQSIFFFFVCVLLDELQIAACGGVFYILSVYLCNVRSVHISRSGCTRSTSSHMH